MTVFRRQNVASGRPLEKLAHYSRAVRAGDLVLQSGTTAIDRQGQVRGEGDAAAQVDAIMTIAEWSMGRVGGRLADVVRSRIYVTDAAVADTAGRALAKYLRDARPAATLVQVSGLARPTQLVEIELDAVDGAGAAARRISSGRPTEDVYAYSRAVRVGDRVFVSGSTALQADGSVDGPGDMYRQTRRTMDTIFKAMEEAGAARGDLVYTKTWLTDLTKADEYTRAWLDALGDVRPTSTLLGIPALLRPEMLIEVEAEAIVGAAASRRDIYTELSRERPRGYARAVEVGDTVYVSGCTSVSPAGETQAAGDWARSNRHLARGHRLGARPGRRRARRRDPPAHVHDGGGDGEPGRTARGRRGSPGAARPRSAAASAAWRGPSCWSRWKWPPSRAPMRTSSGSPPTRSIPWNDDGAEETPMPITSGETINYLWTHKTQDHGWLSDEELCIDRAEGVWVWTQTGQKLLDGFAGLAVVNVGHGRREIAEAIAEQTVRLAYYPTTRQFSNRPAAELAAKLASLTPGDLTYSMFAVSGSEANERSMQIARHYWLARGRSAKHKVISFEGGYHGATMGTFAVCGLPHMAEAYAPLQVPGFAKAKPPHPYRDRGTGTDEELVARRAAELRAIIEREGPDTVSAVLMEPILSSGGFIIPPIGWLAAVRRVCDEMEVLMIADEVITGFGRTGRWFGVDHEGVVPDLMSVAKGITSGYVPLSASIARRHLADAFPPTPPRRTCTPTPTPPTRWRAPPRSRTSRSWSRTGWWKTPRPWGRHSSTASGAPSLARQLSARCAGAGSWCAWTSWRPTARAGRSTPRASRSWTGRRGSAAPSSTRGAACSASRRRSASRARRSTSWWRWWRTASAPSRRTPPPADPAGFAGRLQTRRHGGDVRSGGSPDPRRPGR